MSEQSDESLSAAFYTYFFRKLRSIEAGDLTIGCVPSRVDTADWKTETITPSRRIKGQRVY